MREKLMQILANYFNLTDTYVYNLTRDKQGFTVGTITIDDFEEFNMDVIADIADYLIKNGVTLADHPTEKGGVQEWKSEGYLLELDNAEHTNFDGFIVLLKKV